MNDSASAGTRWRPTLRQRVQLLVGVLLVLLVASGVAAVASNQRAERANRDVADELLPALVAVERLQKAYLDQETGVRGFALTGQRSFLEPYESAPSAIEGQHRSLRAVLAGDPAALAALGEVQRAYEAWRSQAAEPVVTFLLDGRTAAALQLIEAGVGKRLFDALRVRVDLLRSAVQGLVATATGRLDAVTTAALWVIGWSFGLAVLLAAVTMVELRRSVTRPLTSLVRGVSAVAGGDLDRPVEVDGPPEIELMAAAVERMRRTLVEHTRAKVLTESRLATLRESERIATDLRDRVIERLFTTGMSLTSLASRYPALAEPLLAAVHELDGAIQELRGVLFELSEAVPQQRGLRDRVADLVAQAERLLGFAPGLEFHGPVDRVLDPQRADELVATVSTVLSGLTTATRAAVSLAAEADTVRLVVTYDGPQQPGAPAEWTDRLGGPCMVRRDQHGATVLECRISADRRE